MNKRWNFYASNLHLGTHHEHRLSGARIGRVSVRLGWAAMHGWKAEVDVFRLGIEVTLAPRKDDPRVQAWIAAIMGHMDTNAGLADLNDGRMYEGTDDYSGPSRPRDTWKADDPQPPMGWHHDGEKWVQNETGWWRDRLGHWRYNAPGDPGWRERADGSWRYVFADGSTR